MNYDKVVSPSSQLYTALPDWITEQYPRFTEFMSRSLESSERQGFAQNILQNLVKYRDFDYYKAPIVEHNYLDRNLVINEIDELELVDGFGFPEENGVIYIMNPELDECARMKDGEVILYRRREGNTLYDLERGASATTDLGGFTRDAVYEHTVAQNHIRGAKVVNLSTLFLQAMLETIHETFADGVDSKWIYPDINHGTLLERFRDFFQAKGTKLGIKALFKFIFGENDVDVFYPGDRMIEASTSTWVESAIVRVVPFPKLLVTPVQNYILPDRLVNRELQLKSYNDSLNEETKHRIYGRAICDYVSSYEYNDITQYEFFIQKQDVEGNFPANPFTSLTRSLYVFGTGDDKKDVTTITVESTLGFPESGVIFIEDEGIYYEKKTFNQFLNCKRGFINVEANHNRGTRVYGPYYVEGIERYEDDRGRVTELISRSWPLGLVDKIDIKDPGLLHLESDEIYPNGPGRIDPREPIMESFEENYDDELMDQVAIEPFIKDHRNKTAGVSGIYFDDDFVFVTSTNFPYYPVGMFSSDYSVGPLMQSPNAIHVIPRRENIKENFIKIDENGKKEYYFHDKGFKEIGVFLDGVPAFSNVSNRRIFQGCITRYEVISSGFGYVNPTLLVNDEPIDEVITLDTANQGTVVSISATDLRNYDQIPPLPTVRVTGGEDGEIEIEFDIYGRAISATITNPGKYYNDVPTVALVDASTRGKGGLISVTVSGGELATVEILNTGIDYNPNTTKCVITAKGGGADVMPHVQYYQYDRYGEIALNDNWMFDEGGGFLWEKGTNDKEFFGYISYPTSLVKLPERPGAPYLNTELGERFRTADGNDLLLANLARRYNLRTKLFDDVLAQTSVYLNSELRERFKTADDIDFIIVDVGGGLLANRHSSLIGWAYDGNPIYGPYLYRNGVDDTQGYRQMFSGYRLAYDRNEVIPSGGDIPATMPPSENEYPLGTFVEDYVWDPGSATRTARLLSEKYDRIQAENLDYIAVSQPVPMDWVLNENNAIKCNTPEFPAELYPDGVWVYVCTHINGYPSFPYIIGKTFENRPVSQNVSLYTSEDPRPGQFIIYDPQTVDREFPLEFNYDVVERFRNDYLTPTKDELDLRIANTSTGGVSEIVVVDGKPLNSKVGDFVYFDNTGTQGSGALGKVSQLEGEEVISGVGEDITTVTISHYQRLNLNSGLPIPEINDRSTWVTLGLNEGLALKTENGLYSVGLENQYFDGLDDDGYPINYSFVKGSIITTTSKAEAIVLNYDVEGGFLDVYTYTKNLILEGDSFQDERGIWINLGVTEDIAIDSEEGIQIVTEDGKHTLGLEEQQFLFYKNNEDYQARTVYMAYGKPSSLDLVPGDLWFSNQNGRMYIYFNDGDSSQWVCTQPIGMRPLTGASDSGIGTDESTGNIVTNPQKDNLVTISTMAPSERSDGGPNADGDLWWSSHTGILHIWTSNEWVCTDPNATVPTPYASDKTNWEFGPLEIPTEPYECQQTVLISYVAPTVGLNGDVITDGYLWWSPLTGKMYIRYTSSGGPQWVITNPVGILSSSYSIDYIPSGDGGREPPPILPLPLPPVDGELNGIITKLNKGESIIWFEHLIDFDPGDELLFMFGAPGTGETQTATLVRILEPGAPTAAVVRRHSEDFDIPDGCNVLNNTKSLYTVTTERPHMLRTGDMVTLSGSEYNEINNTHKVIRGGVVDTAEGTTTISEGQVTGVNVTYPGSGYTSNFYITFYGGGGSGGYGYVEIDPIDSSVNKVTIVDGGINYTEPPNIFWSKDNLRNTEFQLYLSETYPEENTLFYTTSSLNVQSKVAKVDVLSPGVGYKTLPTVMGTYKKAIDRGEFKVNLAGTTISDVEVINGGARYESPIAVFYDLAGEGTGATAKVDVIEGRIASITIIDGGQGYYEPVMLLVENKGKFIALTDDIGQIQSIKVLNPGRAISPDRSLKPEIMIETRCIVQFDTHIAGSILSPDDYENGFLSPDNYSQNTVFDVNRPQTLYEAMKPGDLVWQGTESGTVKQVTAEFVSYDPETQVITLREVKGNLHYDEYLYNEYGVKGLVLREGQADARCVINGIAYPEGRFIDDSSIISSSYAHLQDSYYYQYFSYSITSPLQQHQFDDFVQSIIHPAGFIMFSDLQVNHQMSAGISVMDPIISGPTETILSPDGFGVRFTALTPGPKYEGNSAMSPDTGTIEL